MYHAEYRAVLGSRPLTPALSPLTKINVLSKIYHTINRRKSWYREEKRQEKWNVTTVIVPITFHSESLSCPVKKEKANQYCHSQLQIKPTFYCFHVLFFFFWGGEGGVQSAVTVTNASESIVGEISELTSGMLFFPSPLCSFFLQNGQGVKQWSKTHKKTAVINKHNKTLI